MSEYVRLCLMSREGIVLQTDLQNEKCDLSRDQVFEMLRIGLWHGFGIDLVRACMRERAQVAI